MSNVIVDTNKFMLSQLNTLREDSKFIDVVVVAKKDNEKVPAHRLLLASRSNFFREIFTKLLPEHENVEIQIEDVTGMDLKNIIRYCYTGEIDLGNDQAKTILATASLFKLTSLINVCNDFLPNNINTANWLRKWIAAEKYYCPKFLAEVKAFIYDHFMEISKSDEFLTLDTRRLREILASNKISVTSEDEILSSLIRWCQHKQREREQYMSDLLSLVRVPFLSPTIVVEQEDFNLKSIAFQTFTNEVLQWHLNPIENRPAINTRQRRCISETLLAVVISKGDDIIQIAKYCQKDDKWTIWTALRLKFKLSFFGVALMNSELVIAAGRLDSDYSKPIDTVTSMNTVTKTLKYLQPMGTLRSFVTLVVLDENMYAIGGVDTGDNWLNNVERWDSRTGLWSNVAPMIEGKAGQNAAILNGRIYVIGHSDISVECYDQHTNSWTVRTAMHERREYPGIAVLNGYLYAIGGCASKTVERYDDKTSTWTMMCSLRSPRHGMGCIAMQHRIIAAGGWNNGNPISTVEEYNPIEDVWIPKSYLNMKGFCIIVRPGNIS